MNFIRVAVYLGVLFFWSSNFVFHFASAGERIQSPESPGPGQAVEGTKPFPPLVPLEQLKSNAIQVWNRAEGHKEVEQVYGDSLLHWVYGTRVGQILADDILSHPWLSQLYGVYQSSSLSEYKINQFVKQFHIPMEEFDGAPYGSFNQFFIRKFRPGVREFISDPSRMGAFAEARYFGYEHFQSDHSLAVKGKVFTIEALLGGEQQAREFVGGPVLVARLAPIDYHRFHFPDDGRMIQKTYPLVGPLQSVNPVALKYKGDILSTNERQVTMLQTKNFGKIAYVEVGALCVGKIVQNPRVSPDFKKGDEKGYFLFGASTVIVLGQPGMWRPDSDMIENTQQGIETLIRLGDSVAVRSGPKTLPLTETSRGSGLPSLPGLTGFKK